MVVFAVNWSACKYHSMWIWQPYSIMYHGITVRYHDCNILHLNVFSLITIIILITIKQILTLMKLSQVYSEIASPVLQYHADNWDQHINEDKVNTISPISHAEKNQDYEFEGISFAFWWFSVEHFLCWRGYKERDHKPLVLQS